MIILKKSFTIEGRNKQWIHVTNPTEGELETLTNDYKIDKELLLDILDPEELARLELFEEGRLVIIRLPVHNPEARNIYSTITFGLFFVGQTTITLCSSPVAIIDDEHFKGPPIEHSSDLSFILSLLLRSNFEYLYYLKDIKKHIETMETTMMNSVSNRAIEKVLIFNRSLQYFDTSLRSNELLLEKLRKARYWSWLEDENELLQDVLIENKEALENVHIYINILQGLTGSFAIVINNNLNHMMTTLTSLSLLVMIPTGIASIYGMNVDLPYMNHPLSFAFLMGSSLLVCASLLFLFKKKRYL